MLISRWITGVGFVVMVLIGGCAPNITPTSTAFATFSGPTATPVKVVLPTDLPTLIPVHIGSLQIEGMKQGADGIITIIGGTTVKISWINGPTNASRVGFYQLAAQGGRILLATDTHMEDGISFDWYAPVGYKSKLTAAVDASIYPSADLTVNVVLP